MSDRDIYLMGIVTIVWLFASIIYLFERNRKVDSEASSDVDMASEEKHCCVVKRNFRTVHPDSRKFFKNLVNDDGTPYINEEFSCSRS